MVISYIAPGEYAHPQERLAASNAGPAAAEVHIMCAPVPKTISAFVPKSRNRKVFCGSNGSRLYSPDTMSPPINEAKELIVCMVAVQLSIKDSCAVSVLKKRLYCRVLNTVFCDLKGYAESGVQSRPKSICCIVLLHEIITCFRSVGFTLLRLSRSAIALFIPERKSRLNVFVFPEIHDCMRDIMSAP